VTGDPRRRCRAALRGCGTCPDCGARPGEMHAPGCGAGRGPGPSGTPPDDIGKLLRHIEALEQVARCYRLGLPPSGELLATVAQTTAWAEQIKASR